MKPQTQEFPNHDPENGVFGDCLRAALASTNCDGCTPTRQYVSQQKFSTVICKLFNAELNFRPFQMF
jgi:hypothetical protein